MPHQGNVRAPISLVGLGRSGTTLVTNVFRAHPGVQALGETGNAVYSTFYHLEKAFPLCGPRETDLPHAEAAALAVHAMLQRVFPSDRPVWFHKPIMLPDVSRELGDTGAFITWYWRVSHLVFPQGRFFTIIREPRELAASFMTRWNTSEAKTMAYMRDVYSLLLAPESRVELVLSFADLQDRPEATIRRLFGAFDLAFHPDSLKPLARRHARNPERAIDAQDINLPPDVAELHGRLLNRAATI